MTDAWGRFLWWIRDPSQFLAIVLAILTVYLVLRQLQLAKKQTSLGEIQTKLMRDQMDLMRRQDEMFAFERARRSDLRIGIKVNGRVAEVQVTNLGNKTAHDFYWHLWVPYKKCEPRMLYLRSSELQAIEVTSLDEQQYYHFTNNMDTPIYPTRAIHIGSVMLTGNPIAGKYQFHWLVICEDGKTPNELEFGSLDFEIP